ncbi:twin-arginine translocase TatA/TatE family subunit [Mucilaginibacter pallidiroseus]|uniref:Sec-independent protein translocase protein TatA n=1 Tax=Mucilaginibacter pallidiroseus TaxID=2599295 RepID=A0A563UGJ8_9SPHI|nr:twin-arginine translocase TatA/TatE family subunit [Mucilaginibacter pallidiroseus]TWR30495.1 twin-arginine translocase TatA/TatE family subunit [Mucilaginibacter pallidiroseus]
MLSSVFLFLNIGGGEMILIVLAALMLFGGEKLPELARGLGKGIRDFKDASDDVKREINNQINNYESKKPETKQIADSEPVAEEPLEETARNYNYEPVAGTISAYNSHAATDAIEDAPELGNPEAPETYNNAEEKPVATDTHTSTIDLTKNHGAEETKREEHN